MISKISAKMADYLFIKSAISKEDREIYSYGFFILLSRIMFFIISATVGLIFHLLPESIVFFVFFSLIRAYAGGIHASTELRCTFFTSAAIFVCVFGIKLSVKHNADYLLLALLILSAILIFLLSPLDTQEKPLAERERKRFKKLSCVFAAVIVFAASVLYLLDLKSFSFSCVFAMIFESVLLVFGKIKQRITVNNEETHNFG